MLVDKKARVEHNDEVRPLSRHERWRVLHHLVLNACQVENSWSGCSLPGVELSSLVFLLRFIFVLVVAVGDPDGVEGVVLCDQEEASRCRSRLVESQFSDHSSGSEVGPTQ